MRLEAIIDIAIHITALCMLPWRPSSRLEPGSAELRASAIAGEPPRQQLRPGQGYFLTFRFKWHRYISKKTPLHDIRFPSTHSTEREPGSPETTTTTLSSAPNGSNWHYNTHDIVTFPKNMTLSFHGDHPRHELNPRVSGEPSLPHRRETPAMLGRRF